MRQGEQTTFRNTKAAAETKTNDVQKIILEQLTASNPLWRNEFKVTTIVLMNENAIRLCCRTKKKINFDIHYDPCMDVYDVKAYLLWNHGLGCATVLDSKGVMFDQLMDLLRIAHKDTPICNQCGNSVAPGSGRFVNRVPSFDNAETRAETGYPHPEGDFTCANCDAETEEEGRT